MDMMALMQDSCDLADRFGDRSRTGGCTDVPILANPAAPAAPAKAPAGKPAANDMPDMPGMGAKKK